MDNKRIYKKTMIASAIAVIIVISGIIALLTTEMQQTSSVLSDVSAQSADLLELSGSSSNYEPKTIQYTLVAEETTIEIAPNVRVEAWTYNDTIPGPTLRATEGDRVIINFINKTPMPHTIHLHGSHDEQDDGVFQEVQPGESYTYDFIAEPAGTLMYHCHVMPVSQHIRMGLYGAFIVDPQTPLPPAREYVLVSGEYDTKDQLTDLPEYIMFNGYADQYWENPLPVRTNELVRVYLINLGDSPAFGFHIHGTLFKAYPSGIWENPPFNVQTWEVAAGNAAIFEAKWPVAGRYLFHFHGTPEEKGTMAYFNVTDASENAVDGVDVASTKSISMVEWQSDLTKKIQKADPNANITQAASQGRHAMSSSNDANQHSTHQDVSHETVETTSVSIPEGSGQPSLHKTFAPDKISIHAGDTVTWTNEDVAAHIVESKGTGLFNSGLILQKRSFEQSFAEVGTFEYYCSLHPWMEGVVEVKP